jgi:site-specific DNA-cytosine methylase
VYFNDVRKTLRHPTGRPAILDLYAGVSGMSLGLEKHFDVRWVIDNDHLAAATLRANKAGLDVCIYMEDVKMFLMHSMQQNPCYPYVGEVNHIHASPSCKGFPRANRNEGKNDIQNKNKLCCS